MEVIPDIYKDNPRIEPQPGPQTQFCRSMAKIVIYGGAAFGGKSYGILLEGQRNIRHPRYNGVIFRRERPQITAGGGLWDTASQIYPYTGGVATQGNLMYRWPSGAYIKFTHLQLEDDKLSHQGAQYVFVGWDELTHFTETQFWYLFSRCRPPTGYNGPCYMRATCNADADSWVRNLISWWLDEETGLADYSKSGVIRYFTRFDERISWVDADWMDQDGNPPTSITFIPAKVDDNKIGLKVDPAYRSNLLAQDKVTRERLLIGNWNITYRGGMFDPTWFRVEDELPAGIKLMRYWDLAATEKKKEDDDPDFTAGALCGFDSSGELWIADMQHFRQTPARVEKRIQQTAEIDGHNVPISIEEEKGGSGKYVSSHFQRNVLRGFEVHPDPVSGDKVDRAKPWCALAERGHVHIIRGPWNRSFLAECGSFPLAKKDQVDAVSGAVRKLTGTKRVLFGYVAANYAHFKEFGKERKHFDSADQNQVRIYLVLYRDPDGGLYGNYFCWSRKSRILRVYNELAVENPIIEHVAYEIREKLVVPVELKAGHTGASLTKVFGNDSMFSSGYNAKKVLRKKAGIRIKQNNAFDEAGAIFLANSMFGDGKIIVHSDCAKTDIDYRSWVVENGKPNPIGSPHSRCLLIVVSELKAEGELDVAPEVGGYSQYKQSIRKKLKSGEFLDIADVKTGARMDDWLAR